MIRKCLSVATLTAAIASAVLAGSVAAAGCHIYSGNFTAVRPDVCTSPVGICTHGTLTGSVLSTYDFTMDSLTFTGPTTALYTGHSVITTKQDAQVFGSDSGTLSIREDGVTADFVTTVIVVGGTRQYANATGTIVAPGVLNLVTGATVGTYSGTICLGDEDESSAPSGPAGRAREALAG